MKVTMTKEGVEQIKVVLKREVEKLMEDGELQTAMALKNLTAILDLATEIKIEKTPTKDPV